MKIIKSNDYFPLSLNFFEFTRERIEVPTRFRPHSTCFQTVPTVSKFQVFIRILTMEKRGNKTGMSIRELLKCPDDPERC